jgi:hypothetical protein
VPRRDLFAAGLRLVAMLRFQDDLLDRRKKVLVAELKAEKERVVVMKKVGGRVKVERGRLATGQVVRMSPELSAE